MAPSERHQLMPAAATAAAADKGAAAASGSARVLPEAGATWPSQGTAAVAAGSAAASSQQQISSTQLQQSGVGGAAHCYPQLAWLPASIAAAQSPLSSSALMAGGTISTSSCEGRMRPHQPSPTAAVGSAAVAAHVAGSGSVHRDQQRPQQLLWSHTPPPPPQPAGEILAVSDPVGCVHSSGSITHLLLLPAAAAAGGTTSIPVRRHNAAAAAFAASLARHSPRSSPSRPLLPPPSPPAAPSGSAATSAHPSSSSLAARSSFLAVRRRTVALINAVSIMERMDEQIVPALSRPLGCAFRAGPHQLGLITFARAVVQAVASPLGGLAGHYFDRVSVLFVGCAVWGFFCTAFAFARTVNEGMAAWAFNGVGLSLIIPNSQSLVADYYSATQRGEAFGTLMLTGAVGGMLGAVFATNLGGRSGLTPLRLDGWRLAFGVVGAASFLIGATTLLLAVDPTRHHLLAHRRRRGGGGAAGGAGGAGRSGGGGPRRHRVARGGGGGGLPKDAATTEHTAAAAAAADAADTEWDWDSAGSGSGSGSGAGPSAAGGRQGAAAWRPSPADVPPPPPSPPSPEDVETAPLLLAYRSSSTSQQAAATAAGSAVLKARGDEEFEPPAELRSSWEEDEEAQAAAEERRRRRRGSVGNVSVDGDAVTPAGAGGGGGPPPLTWRRLWRMLTTPTFLIIILQGIVGSTPWNALVFLTLYFQLLGFSDAAASALMATLLGGTAAGALVGGWLGDRVAERWPNHGRIALVQFSVAVGVPLSVLLLRGLPTAAAATPAAAAAYGLVLLVKGVLTSWAAPACNNPVFAEIVPPDMRNLVYAFDRSFEGAISALGAPLVGMAAERWFGFSGVAAAEDSCEPHDSAPAAGGLGGPAPDLLKARSLGDAMLLFMVVPWTLCALFYTGLHWTYPRDRARALRPQVADVFGGKG